MATVSPSPALAASEPETPARATGPAPNLPPEAAAAVLRFAPSLRRALRRFAKLGPAFADLLTSFPAAAVAIATGRGSAEGRAEALRRIANGESRKRIAEPLDLAYWLKRFAPEALPLDIPLELGFVEPSPGLYDRLCRRAPVTPAMAREWLSRVFAALSATPGEFAMWYGCVAVRAGLRDVTPPPLLAAYAHFSQAPGTLAADLITTPWSADMSWAQALKCAREWGYAVLFEHAVSHANMIDQAVAESRFDGYRVVPLIDPLMLRSEGVRMANCILTYWPKMLRGECTLFRITGKSARANFEVRHGREPGVLRVSEIKGVDNASAGPRIRAAAKDWVDGMLAPAGDYGFPLRYSVRPDVWSRFWDPYWDIYGASARIPRRPSHFDLVELFRGVGVMRPSLADGLFLEIDAEGSPVRRPARMMTSLPPERIALERIEQILRRS